MRYHNPRQLLSPKSFIEKVTLVYDGGEESFSIALINWEGTNHIGIRWNVSRREWDDPEKASGNKICSGMPVVYGHPIWFILPNDLFEVDSEGHISLTVLLNHLSETRRSNDRTRHGRNEENVLHLMIGPKEGGHSHRQSALKEIRDFTANATELIIIDPYIFGGETIRTNEYIEEFKRSSRIDNKKLKKINIILNSKMGNTSSIKTGIKQLAQNNNCKLTMHDSEKIHDRIWIKDRNEAIVIGTSFGGIGSKLCFLLPLPDEDLDNLLLFLDDQNMLKENYR